jgi:hypothetical protein
MINSSFFAFFRFHLSVGIRVALRVLVATVAVFFALFYLLRPELFIGATALLISHGVPGGLASAVSFLIFAGIASRRICLGLTGWIRHLAATGSLQRRLAALAVLTAQLPIILIWTVLAFAAGHMYGVRIVPFLAGLPISAAAASLAVLPVRRKYLTLSLAAAAAVLAGSSNWLLLAGGILLMTSADLSAGPIVPVRSRTVFSLPGGVAFHLAIAWRALRFRVIIPYIPSLFMIGLSFFFLANNTVSQRLAATVVRLNGALGLIIFSGIFANILASRRPPWPWARSFPTGARTRIRNDALLIFLHAAVLLIPVALTDFIAFWPLAASLPLLAVRAARAVPLSGDIRSGPLGLLAGESALPALLIILIPPASLSFLLIAPLALREAARAEKAQKVSRWLELHHLAAGDPLSWSRQ